MASKPVLPRWRIVTYAIIVFNLLMLAWVLAAVVWVYPGCGVLEATVCERPADSTRAIAISLIIALWALGNVVLGGLWIATDVGAWRPCPRCGKHVKDVAFRCPGCGHDFHIGLQPRSGRYEPPGGHA